MDSSITARKMAMESINILVVLFTRVSSKMTFFMAMESKNLLMVPFTTVSSKMTYFMVMDYLHGVMVQNSKGSFIIRKYKAKESTEIQK